MLNRMTARKFIALSSQRPRPRLRLLSNYILASFACPRPGRRALFARDTDAGTNRYGRTPQDLGSWLLVWDFKGSAWCEECECANSVEQHPKASYSQAAEI